MEFACAQLQFQRYERQRFERFPNPADFLPDPVGVVNFVLDCDPMAIG